MSDTHTHTHRWTLSLLQVKCLCPITSPSSASPVFSSFKLCSSTSKLFSFFFYSYFFSLPLIFLSPLLHPSSPASAPHPLQQQHCPFLSSIPSSSLSFSSPSPSLSNSPSFFNSSIPSDSSSLSFFPPLSSDIISLHSSHPTYCSSFPTSLLLLLLLFTLCFS